MTRRLIVNPALCTGCRTCELACSFTHAVNGTLATPRIRPIESATRHGLFVPVVCLQCESAACVKSCLVDALSRNPETGGIDLDHDRCVRCMACVAACPFGCSIIEDSLARVSKCDLCGGDPACARFCPTKALEYREAALQPAPANTSRP